MANRKTNPAQTVTGIKADDFELSDLELREDYNSGKLKAAQNAETASLIAYLLARKTLSNGEAEIITTHYQKLDGVTDYGDAKEIHLEIGAHIDAKVPFLEQCDEYRDYWETYKPMPSLIKKYRALVGPEGQMVLDVLREREIELRREETKTAYTWNTAGKAAFGKLPHESSNTGKDRIRHLVLYYQFIGLLEVKKKGTAANSEHTIRFTDEGFGRLMKARRRARDISETFVRTALNQGAERKARGGTLGHRVVKFASSFVIALGCLVFVSENAKAEYHFGRSVSSAAEQMGSTLPKFPTAQISWQSEGNMLQKMAKAAVTLGIENPMAAGLFDGTFADANIEDLSYRPQLDAVTAYRNDAYVDLASASAAAGQMGGTKPKIGFTDEYSAAHPTTTWPLVNTAFQPVDFETLSGAYRASVY